VIKKLEVILLKFFGPSRLSSIKQNYCVKVCKVLMVRKNCRLMFGALQIMPIFPKGKYYR